MSRSLNLSRPLKTPSSPSNRPTTGGSMRVGLRPSTHHIDHVRVAGSKARMPKPRYSPSGRSRILSSIVPSPPRVGQHALLPPNSAQSSLPASRSFSRRCQTSQLPTSHRQSRSEEHTSELQSLMRISYAVFCLKKKNNNTHFNYV